MSKKEVISAIVAIILGACIGSAAIAIAIKFNSKNIERVKEEFTEAIAIVHDVLIPSVDDEVEYHTKEMKKLENEQGMFYGYHYGYVQALLENKKTLMKMLNAFNGEQVLNKNI